MAFQLLYSFWQENGNEKSFCATSKGLAEEDASYILRHTVKNVAFHDLPEGNMCASDGPGVISSTDHG